MSIVRIALAASALVAGVATVVVAQTAPPPNNPNTKVYAYKKTAPQPTSPDTNTYAGAPAQPTRMDPDVPRHGSPQWWAEKNRYGNGAGE
jgi:hypothetical protein